MIARRLPVPARNPGEAGDVGDLDIERGGVEQVEPASDSMRCQARGALLGAAWAGRVSSDPSINESRAEGTGRRALPADMAGAPADVAGAPADAAVCRRRQSPPVPAR